jgi:hypothetical protein
MKDENAATKYDNEYTFIIVNGDIPENDSVHMRRRRS